MATTCTASDTAIDTDTAAFTAADTDRAWRGWLPLSTAKLLHHLVTDISFI